LLIINKDAMRYFLGFAFLLFFFGSCESKISTKKEVVSEEKDLVNKSIKSNKITNLKPKEIALDTINSKNKIAFLKAYGKENPETVILFETRLGNIKIQLYKETPLHRASFIFLTKTGYFSTTCFHRVVSGFIVQGGNSDLPITRKKRIKYNYKIPAEIKSYYKHSYGSLAAARQWDDNSDKISSPFEFYMIQDKRGSHHLDGEHTIFGKIIEGLSVMEAIAQLKTDNKEWPVKDVFIKASVIQ